MDPDLDDRLRRSAPRLEDVPDLQPALTELVTATRATPRRRVGRRGVLISTTTAGIVFAGTAAAAALGFGPWSSPAGKNPDGSLAFTMPNGVACEYRIGDLDSDGDTDKLRAWLDERTLAEITDVAAMIETIRAEDNHYFREDGTAVEIGYGTPYYDANNEYVDAVRRAVQAAIGDQARAMGVVGASDQAFLSSGSEIRCADGWEPDSDWLPEP